MIPGSANTLLLATAAAAGGYEIERSLRFNSADSAYLSRTPASAGNRKTWTWAGWVKRSNLTNGWLLTANHPTASWFIFGFSSDKLYLSYTAGTSGAGENVTAAVFRDASAWYHIVLAFDSTQATAADRIKIYVNGSQQTLSTGNPPSLNTDYQVNNNVSHLIGGYASYFLNGYLADVHFIDGQALDPTSFTEVSATTGQLIPKAYSGSFGTNGFWLKFSDNSAATATTLGKDYSGNNNNFTPNNLAVDATRTLPAVAFDGNGDYLTVPGSSDFAFGTGDFTIEFFLYSKEASPNNKDVFSNPAGIQLFFVSGKLRYNHALVAGLLDTDNAIPQNKWTHCALVRNGGTTRWYVNGVQNSGSYSDSKNWTQTTSWYVGSYDGTQQYSNILISNLRVVKGTAVYTSNFTPTAPLTSVTNTKLLCCQSSSSATTAAVSPGTITASGDVYATTLTDSQPGNDSLVDTPTNYGEDTGAGGEVRGNYATLNPLAKGSTHTLSNGNLDCSMSGSSGATSTFGTIGVSSGKWYWELAVTGAAASYYPGIGVETNPVPSVQSGSNTTGYTYLTTGEKLVNSTLTAYGASFTAGDIVGVALNMDAGTLTCYKNGVSQGQLVSGITGVAFPVIIGQISASGSLNFGQRPFAYPAPSGFKALCTTNLPAPTVEDGSQYMDVVLDTGANILTAAQGSISGSADLLWIKDRANANNHQLIDTVRGGTATLQSNTNAAETTYSAPSGSSVAWTWDAGSSTVTNTAGTITSQVRANPSAGFSIVTYTGTLAAETVGHGLNAIPEMIIVKERTGVRLWVIYTKTTGRNAYMSFDTNASTPVSNYWGLADPTSSVFGLNAYGGNNSGGRNYVAYCFAPVSGYSSFGNYTGNGSTDGPFVYTGFRPRWILYKASSAAYGWAIHDTKRSEYNTYVASLYPNASDAEYNGAGHEVDILSNGFKLRNSNTLFNASGVTYIYAAFAEHPFSLARAR